MALLTTMPASITAPIITSTLIEVAVTSRAATIPTAPSGTAIKMTSGWSSDSNWEAMTT